MPKIMTLTRKWATTNSTIGELRIPDAQNSELRAAYVLERPGPDTTQSGRRLRVPEGTFNLKWQGTTTLRGIEKYLPVPWLHNAQVADSRYIYIHNGNYPRNTDGCLLVGSSRSKDMVGNSGDTLIALKAYLNRVGIENVLLRIDSAYS